MAVLVPRDGQMLKFNLLVNVRAMIVKRCTRAINNVEDTGRLKQ